MARILAMMVLCVVMVVVAPYAEAAISCGSVVGKLAPCASYLSKGGTPPSGCCSGVKGVLALAKTTPDKQDICVCLKSAAKGVNAGFAESLPGKCGVSIPYKISPSTDCSKIH